MERGTPRKSPNQGRNILDGMNHFALDPHADTD